MTFVALDEKEWCKGIYQDGVLSFNDFPTNLDRTWKYVPFLDGKDIQYASLYCNGQELEEVCPETLKNEWTLYNRKLEAFLRSFLEAKINLNEHCVYDLIPPQFLLEYCSVKTKIIDNVFETYKKPTTYDFSVELEKVLYKIKKQELKIDTASLKNKRHEVRVREILKNLDGWSKNIDFNQFGTKTGRLTTKKHTFPILNLNSDFRSIIKPNNDYFLELDFNAAELRVLIGLAGQQQPSGDLHDFNAKRLGVTRAEAKKDAFAWLYGSSKVDATKFNEIFNTTEVLSKYFDGLKVINHFGREIEADDFHALNYIVQSTTSDMVLRQVIKVADFLKDKLSTIGFIVHDSLVIDVAHSELSICNRIIEIFSNCEFGVLPVRCKLGKDYGSLKEIKR